jgi:competence ComEA-like helix-hairpin-helix protein
LFNLTSEERKVILFLIAIALAGIAINFFLKINSNSAKIFKADERIAKIDINQASLEDLLASRVVPQRLAEKIIAYRNEHGQFNNLEYLKRVKGIGNYRLEKLKEILFVE